MQSSTQNLSRLTIDNFQSKLKKWKEPFLNEANQTAMHLQNKIKAQQQQYTQKKISSTHAPITPFLAQKSSPYSLGIQAEQDKIDKSQQKRTKTEVSQKYISSHIPNKLQEWRANNEYGFKSYEQLIQNYGQVFERKQKIKKNKNEEIEDYRIDEKKMIQAIFQQLKNQNELTVSFAAIQAFFQKYQLFYYFYNVLPYRLTNLLKQASKRYNNKLTRQQFFDFFLVDRANITEFTAKTQKKPQHVCILSEHMWKKLKDTFELLDTFGDGRISVRALFQKLRTQMSNISLQMTPVIQIPSVERTYTLQKVLFDLENKVQFGGKISWEEIQNLINGFTHIEKPTLDEVYLRNIQKGKITSETNAFMLNHQAIQIIKDIFIKCLKYAGYFVKTSFFAQQLLQTGILKPYFSFPTRLQKQKKICLEEIIKRFSKETQPYIDMDEMLELLSIKGPVHQKRMMVFYDDIETSSSEQETEEAKKQQKLKKVKSLEILKKQSKNKKQIQPSTIIQEFNLYKRTTPTIRQQKVKMMLQEKEMEDEIQLGKKFKANPIPNTINSERYQKYMKVMQKKKDSFLHRNDKTKQKDDQVMEHLKANTKLFNAKNIKNHCQKPKQIYQYKASTVPLTTCEQLLQKIQEQKHERRMRIWEQANKMYRQVYWKDAIDVTFSEKQSMLENLRNLNFKEWFQNIKPTQVPNFQELHKKFQEQLQERKKKYQPTKIVEFKLSQPSTKKVRQTNEYLSPQKHFHKPLISPKSQNVIIKSTKKYEDMVAYNQARQEERQQKQINKKQQKEQRITKQKNFAQFMRRNLSNCTNNTELLKHKSQEKLKDFKKHLKKLQRHTEEQLAEMYARVLQRPFLFEEANATRRPNSQTRQNKHHNLNAQQDHVEYPYKEGLFEKEGEQFHPIESENLNQSF